MPTEIAKGEFPTDRLKKFAFPQQLSSPGYLMNVERSIASFEGLLEVSKGAGHISSNRDSDGTVRRVPLVVNLEGAPFPAFGLAVTAAYLQVSPENILIQPGTHLLLRDTTMPGKTTKGDIKIPIDDHGMMVINYAGRWEDTFVHYSFIDVMKAAESEKGKEDMRESLKGKLCLISNTATGYDLKPVPVEENFPGGGIHANIVNTILTESFLREVSPASRILILVILGLAEK